MVADDLMIGKAHGYCTRVELCLDAEDGQRYVPVSGTETDVVIVVWNYSMDSDAL